MVMGVASVYYREASQNVDLEHATALLAPIASGPVPIDWTNASGVELSEQDLLAAPEGDARYDAIPPEASKAKSYEAFKRDLADSLFRTAKLDLLRSEALEAVSKPDEPEREFRARLALLARERRDAATDALRAKYAPKLAALQDRLRRAQNRTEVQQAQASQAKLSSALMFGTAILGAFLGKKVASAGNISKMGSAARGAGRAMQESGDVARAEEDAKAIEGHIAALNAQVQGEIDALAAKYDVAGEELERISLRPKKTNIKARAVVLAWVPVWVDASGSRVNAWE